MRQRVARQNGSGISANNQSNNNNNNSLPANFRLLRKLHIPLASFLHREIVIAMAELPLTEIGLSAAYYDEYYGTLGDRRLRTLPQERCFKTACNFFRIFNQHRVSLLDPAVGEGEGGHVTGAAAAPEGIVFPPVRTIIMDDVDAGSFDATVLLHADSMYPTFSELRALSFCNSLPPLIGNGASQAFTQQQQQQQQPPAHAILKYLSTAALASTLPTTLATFPRHLRFLDLSVGVPSPTAAALHASEEVLGTAGATPAASHSLFFFATASEIGFRDEQLFAVSQLRQLDTLVLSGHSRLTDRGICSHILSSMLTLRTLCLSRTNITGACFRSMLLLSSQHRDRKSGGKNGGPETGAGEGRDDLNVGPAFYIEQLDLSHCPRFDDDGLRAVGAALGHLAVLTVFNCGSITEEGGAMLVLREDGIPQLHRFCPPAALLQQHLGRASPHKEKGCGTSHRSSSLLSSESPKQLSALGSLAFVPCRKLRPASLFHTEQSSSVASRGQSGVIWYERRKEEDDADAWRNDFGDEGSSSHSDGNKKTSIRQRHHRREE